MKQKGFTVMELFGVLIAIGLLALLVSPIVVNLLERRKGMNRLESANVAIGSANYFFTKFSPNYPTEGLEFICDGKKCEATIGMVVQEDGISKLKEEIITYELILKENIPTSGSIILYSDGTIIPKNLAIDSHLCSYDEKLKVFTSC